MAFLRFTCPGCQKRFRVPHGTPIPRLCPSCDRVESQISGAPLAPFEDLVAAVEAEQLEEMSKANLEAFPPPPLPIVFKPIEPSFTSVEAEPANSESASSYLRATEGHPATGTSGCLQVAAYGFVLLLVVGSLDRFFGPLAAAASGGLIFSLIVFRYLSLIERRLAEIAALLRTKR